MELLPMPARLYGIMAREAPRAVILRRGPSKWVRLILWHTDTDTFESGQWLRGRIYGPRCDLSPDGKLFVYFAAQHHKRSAGYGGTWTAISKPPYLTALALWPLGHTWAGGGEFINDHTVFVWHCGELAVHPEHRPPASLTVYSHFEQVEARDRETAAQIKANGWQLVHRGEQGDHYRRRLDDPPIWRRMHPTLARYALVRRIWGYFPDHYPGPVVQDYALVDQETGIEKPLESAAWADWDQRGRLVYARDGQLFAQAPAEVGTFARPLTDFNDQTFESIPAPEWAARW